MKIELNENKVYLNNGSVKKEIHPFWLRERVDGEEFLDKGTQQRLFDPKIGRAHVRTPVTSQSRMPSSA